MICIISGITLKLYVTESKKYLRDHVSHGALQHLMTVVEITD